MVCKQLIILFMDGNILNAAAEKTPIEKEFYLIQCFGIIIIMLFQLKLK